LRTVGEHSTTRPPLHAYDYKKYVKNPASTKYKTSQISGMFRTSVLQFKTYRSSSHTKNLQPK